MRIDRGRRVPAIFRLGLSTAALAVVFSPAAIATTYTWDAGILSTSGVPSTRSTADTLTTGSKDRKYVDTGLTNQDSVAWNDTVYFLSGDTISNAGAWVARTNASLSHGGWGWNFGNSGVFDAGAYSVAVNIDWSTPSTPPPAASSSTRQERPSPPAHG